MATRDTLLLGLCATIRLLAGESDGPAQRFAASYAREAAGDLGGAEAAIAPLRRSLPGDYLLNLRLGWLAYRSGQQTRAQDLYRAAAWARPQALEPHLGLMASLGAQQRWSEVATIGYRVLSAEPGNLAANRMLAEALLQQGFVLAAEDTAERISRLHPADAELSALLGRIRATAHPPARLVANAQAAAPAPQPHVDVPTLSLGVAAYAGQLDYQGATARQSANVGGLGVTLDLPQFARITTDVSATRLEFAHAPAFSQVDAALLVGRWTGSWYLGLGAHGIRDHTHGWHAGRAGCLSAWWQASSQLHLGVDASVARFAAAIPAVTALQGSPNLGWCSHLLPSLTVGQDVTATAIHLDQDVGHGHTWLWSGGTRVWFRHAAWTLSAGGWTGMRSYAVMGGGLAVYDLPALYRRGYDLRLERAGAGGTTLAVQLGREDFHEATSRAPATVGTLVISLGTTF